MEKRKTEKGAPFADPETIVFNKSDTLEELVAEAVEELGEWPKISEVDVRYRARSRPSSQNMVLTGILGGAVLGNLFDPTVGPVLGGLIGALLGSTLVDAAVAWCLNLLHQRGGQSNAK